MNWFRNLLGRETRRQRNLSLLAPIGDGDANSQHIASRNAARHEAARLLRIALRRAKDDRQKGLAEIELYLDDWIFNNGPITTKEQFDNAMRDCVDRIRQRIKAARKLAEARAENDLTEMKDFPV